MVFFPHQGKGQKALKVVCLMEGDVFPVVCFWLSFSD